MILRRLTVGAYGTNCYILGSETTRAGMVIDPGAEPERIIKSIKELDLKVKFIVITHGHTDHVGALNRVREATGAEAAIHARDSGGRPESPGTLRFLKDGDTIAIDNLSFTVLHTPGHSAGGISLVGDGVIFSGDTLFNSGIGRYDLPDSNYHQLMDSLKKLLSYPDDTVVLPGHGPETTIGAEKRGNPFLT